VSICCSERKRERNVYKETREEENRVESCKSSKLSNCLLAKRQLSYSTNSTPSSHAFRAVRSSETEEGGGEKGEKGRPEKKEVVSGNCCESEKEEKGVGEEYLSSCHLRFILSSV